MVRFLTSDLHGQIADKGLSFRVLIAANMLMQSAAELRAEPQRSQEAEQRLRAVLARDPQSGGSTTELKAQLAELLRSDPTLHAPVMAAMTETLRAQLACNNPVFSLDEEIE